MGHQDSAERGRSNRSYTETLQLSGEFRAKPLGDFRELQDQRALDIPIAVKTGRKHEVPFQQGGMLFENCEDFAFGHKPLRTREVRLLPLPFPER